MKKNHEILGRKWDAYLSPAKMVKAVRQDLAELLKFPECETRSHCIRTMLCFPALKHLGFGNLTGREVRKAVERGADLCVQYFDDTWWRPEKLNQSGFSKEDLLSIKATNRLGLDKSNPKRELKWFEAFTSALFLAGLAGRWDDLAKIGSWFDATIEPEYQAGQIEDEYMLLFVCIAGSLCPQPMPGGDKLLAKVKKCRTKRPRLLCAAWEAAQAADQAAFDKAFSEAMKYFKPEDGQPYAWLAIDQSSIGLIAEHRGLKLPPLGEKLQAAVVTRTSAGLAE